jgi:hypothetical protein
VNSLPESARATCPSCEFEVPACICGPEDLECTKCGGEGCFWGAEAIGFDPVNDDPDALYDCAACGGTGHRKDQTIW